MTDIVEQELIEVERIYFNFFDSNEKYKERIVTLIKQEGRRLIIDLNDLRNVNLERVEKLMKNSFVEIMACQKALKRWILNVDPEFCNSHEEFFVGFEGSFGERQLNPRTLTSEFSGNMVCVEGIVTKTSIVKSKVVHSVHYCPNTNKFIERDYKDMTSLDPIPSSGAYPTKDDEGNILETEFGLSLYKDSQSVTIQEMPENAPAGQMPRSIDVILEHDLVDSCKAGDRVYVSGQFRSLSGKRGGFTTSVFNAILIANNVYAICHKANAKFENVDLAQIRNIAKKPNIMELLSRSIAPTICGHEFIKRAILCQLLGGVERVLANGTRIRGDINVLLLGDPSVAKSQFLRFVLQCAKDRAIATTGRGSSGVGLTAAVVTDTETGERGLQAGAMVLADRGIVCIDEFDKMSDIDRTAIHEVMEQGRVTIAKAGIHAKLNARCSVLAAANPVYGRYDQYKTPMENIGLQDSLLSRFDLLFIILDQCDEEMDRIMTEFIGQVLKYRAPGEEDGQVLPLQVTYQIDYVGNEEPTNKKDNKATQIYEDRESFLYSANKKRHDQYLTTDFLQKYIHMARQMNPKLTLRASEILHAKYCDLRNQETERSDNKYRTQPITPRTMETLIRLATAHAKARMSKTVSEADAENAADLVSYVMFREVLKKQNKRSKPNESDDESDINSAINDLTVGSQRPVKKLRTELVEVEDKENNEVVETLSDANMTEITKALSAAFVEIHDSSMAIVELIERVQRKKPTFTESHIRICLQKLHDDNRIMLTEDEVYML